MHAVVSNLCDFLHKFLHFHKNMATLIINELQHQPKQNYFRGYIYLIKNNSTDFLLS